MTRQEKKDLLIFRMKNIFLNNPDEVWTRKDFFELFPYDRQSHILFALEQLVSDKCIQKNTIDRKYIYQYKNIRTRKTDAYSDLFNAIDSEMTFGVEFEFGSKVDTSDIYQMLEEAGFDLQRLNSLKEYENWNVINDGSVVVRGYFHDVEIVSPILKGKKGLAELQRMTVFLNQLKKIGIIKQNRTCGTHVHHSAKKFTAVSKLIYAGEMAQPIMNQFVTRHRAMTEEQIERYEMNVDTVYQAPIKKDKYFDGKKLKVSFEKYINLNVNKFRKYGTVEFRQLQGTTQFRKITSWIIMAQRVIRGSKKYKNSHKISNTKQFFTYFNIDEPSIQKSLVA